MSNRYFDIEDVNKIAIVAPTATLIEIKDYKVINKKDVTLPDSVVKFVKCVNPNCITNHEDVLQKFTVIDKNNVKLQCHYCKKTTEKDNFSFI